MKFNEIRSDYVPDPAAILDYTGDDEDPASNEKIDEAIAEMFKIISNQQEILARQDATLQELTNIVHNQNVLIKDSKQSSRIATVLSIISIAIAVIALTEQLIGTRPTQAESEQSHTVQHSLIEQFD